MNTFEKKWIFSLLFISAFFWNTSPIWGSQTGLVKVKRALILSEPDEEGDVLLKVKKGQVLKVSDGHKRGWHKVLLPQPQDNRRFGWIKGSEMTFESREKELDQAGIQRFSNEPKDPGIHRWTIMPLVDANLVKPSAFQSGLGVSPESIISPAFGLEIGHRIETTWTVSLRGTRQTFSHSYETEGVSGDYYGRLTTGAILGEYFLLHDMPWKAGVAIGFGGAFSVVGGVENNLIQTETDSYASFLALAKLTGRYYVSDFFGFMAGLGYQYIHPQNVEFNGGQVKLDVSSAFLELGFQFEF